MKMFNLKLEMWHDWAAESCVISWYADPIYTPTFNLS